MTKVAFITGASRGIGKETALSFARNGYDVAISARTVEEGQQPEGGLTDASGKPLAGSLSATADEIRALGRKAWVVPLDLLDSQSVLAAAADVLAQAGRVDVLVNNAVYQGGDLNSLLVDLDPETLDRVHQGYIVAPFLLSRAIGAHMLERGEGVIINVTSGAGESNPPLAANRGGWGYAYAAGKAAVSRLSGVIRAEWGKQGIRAYTVNPGVVTTEALKATIGEAGVKALGAGSAPPTVPAEVMQWLASSDINGEHQKRTVHAQPFALEKSIVPPWSSPIGG